MQSAIRLLVFLCFFWGLPLYAADLTLTWQDNSINEEGFIIEKSDENMLTWTALISLGVDVTTYIDACTDGTFCCYRVLAYNTHGSSIPSNTACGPKPAAPSNLVVQ